MLSGYRNLADGDVEFAKVIVKENLNKGFVTVDQFQKILKRDKGYAMQLMDELEMRCIVGPYNNSNKRQILIHEPFTIRVKDHDGEHIIRTDTDCVFQCRACKAERIVTKSDLDENNNVKKPLCVGCNILMDFKYWLDCQE